MSKYTHSKMKRHFNSLFVLLAIVSLSSCATIFTKSSYPVTITTSPEGAQVQITNRAGCEVYAGNTPASVRLKSSAKYMAREEYTITLTKEGYQQRKVFIDANLDGWYLGNILLGGFIGMLIVDPASGAMYKLAVDEINETLVPTENATTEARELLIYDINDLPAGISANDLVRLN